MSGLPAVQKPPPALREDDADQASTAAASSTPSGSRVAGADAATAPPASAARPCPDSLLFLERASGGGSLPVDGAWSYNLNVLPVEVPSNLVKFALLPVFWGVCLLWHGFQRDLQHRYNLPGETGQRMFYQRSRPAGQQVAINMACVLLLSLYSLGAYLGHHWIMRHILNPLFTPRSWLAGTVVSFVMCAVAIFSSFHLRDNWVASAAGLFAFFGFAVCGRTVQMSASSRGQVGLGPSRAAEDAGASFHADGACAETGCRPAAGAQLEVRLLNGDAASAAGVKGARFASVLSSVPPTFADDAVVVEVYEGSPSCKYLGPCGRANIFRLDCCLVLAVSCGWQLPYFLIGSGGSNQCAGLTEFVCSLVYVPIGYTCFAVFGFRLAMATRWSMMVVVLYSLWPAINLALGGKGCSTLTDLVTGHSLPQVWNTAADTIEWNRGFAECTDRAFHIGGETLLVASTTIAAWVHIMSNFSFIVGFASGMVQVVRGGVKGRGEVVLMA